MEEKERNSSTKEKIEFIRENYKKQTFRDDFRNGSITGSIYEALLAIKAEVASLGIMLTVLENELRELKTSYDDTRWDLIDVKRELNL